MCNITDFYYKFRLANTCGNIQSYSMAPYVPVFAILFKIGVLPSFILVSLAVSPFHRIMLSICRFFLFYML